MSRFLSPWSRTFRPRLDRLEGREVPATIVVNTLNDPLESLVSPGTPPTFAPDGGLVSLREALESVNNGQNVGDVVASGAYGTSDTILFTGLTGTLLYNPNNSTSYTISKSVVLQGPGAGALTVSGKDTASPTPGRRRVFDITGAAAVTFANLTVADGQVQGDGAGIRNEPDVAPAALTVSGVTFVNNQALSVPSSPAPAPSSGGAVATNGSLTVTGSTFTTNTATGSGGGVYAVGATLQVQDTTFTGNQAPGQSGGGLYADRANGRLDRVTFGGNAAQTGGGLAVVVESPTDVLSVTRATFDGNTATASGGAVAVARTFSSPVQLANFDLEDATLTRNTAQTGGGGLYYNDVVGSGGGIVRTTNSIVAGNTGPAAPDVSGQFVSRGVNLFSSTLGGTGFSAADLVVADPLLSPLADNGGLTQTAAPRGGSPALGAADPSVSAADLTTDQRGKARATPRTIGAVEPQRPTAAADGPYTLPFNGGTVAAPGVLANDQANDVFGPLTATLVAAPPATSGTLVLNPDGSFTFTPFGGFSGTATFVYRASDGVTTSPDTTVTFTVVVVPPTANPDAYTVASGQTLTVPAPGFLANDTRGDGPGPLVVGTFGSITPSTAGVLTPAVNGSVGTGGFTFAANPTYTGPATFTYTASDGLSTSSPAVVTITVVARPTARDDQYTLPPGGGSVAAPGVLANDTPGTGGGSRLTATLSQGVAAGSGTLTFNHDGSFAFVPAAGVRSASFQYTVSDGTGTSAPATVTLTISANALVAGDKSYGPVTVGTPLTVSAADGLLAGVPAGAGVRVINATPTVGSGTLSVAADGGFTFTPAAVGTSSFTYQLTDDSGVVSGTGTVSVSTTAAPLSPVVRYTAYGTGAGLRAQVRVVRPGQADLTLLPFEDTFLGGVRVAVADVNLDGVDDIVVGAGPGGGPRVTVYDGATGVQIANFFAFEDTFRGGAHVAAADSVTPAGRRTSLLVVGAGSYADQPGSPRVRAFKDFQGVPTSGDTTGTSPVDFIAYDPRFQGGVRVAAGDLNGDGTIELVTIAGPSGGPDLRVWDTAALTGTQPALKQQLNGLGAGNEGYRGGAFVAVAGGAVLVTPDSVPDVTGTVLASLGNTLSDTSGAFPAAAFSAATTSRPPAVSVFLPTAAGSGTLAPVPVTVDLADPGFLGGVRVTAGIAADASGVSVLVGYGAGGHGKVRQFAFNPAGGVTGVSQVIDRTTETDLSPFGDLGDSSIYVGLAPLPYTRTSASSVGATTTSPVPPPPPSTGG